jgi:LPS O-antigen subunit length determinant protein (WzzB/FepE family)
MNQLSNNIKPSSEIDLGEIFRILLKNKYKIITTTAICSILAVFFSLSIPNEYVSRAVLAEEGGGSKGLPSQYASVASMAGIDLGSSNGSNKLSIAIEKVKSLDFFEDFLEKHNLYYEIMGVSGWDSSSDVLINNDDFFDKKNNKWIADIPFAIEGKPSTQTIHREFLSNFSISKDAKTDFTIVSMKHYSPFVAKNILDLIIDDVNEMTRLNDISSARQSIKFLQTELIKTNISDLKVGLNELIKKNIEKIAVANSSPEYLLKVISSPVAPELKSAPKRSLIVLLTLFISFFISCTIVCLFNIVKKNT